MPEEIVARILRLSGYGTHAWEAGEATNTLTLSIGPTGGALACIRGRGMSRDDQLPELRRVRPVTAGIVHAPFRPNYRVPMKPYRR